MTDRGLEPVAKSNLLPSLGEGFRLIVREPVSVLVWGLITFAAAFIPMIAYWALVGPEMIQFYGDLAKASGDGAGETPPPPGITGAAAIIQLLQFVLTPVSGALVFAGMYRAVLAPEEGGFGHVKFGRDEFHVGVSLVVMYVLMIVVIILAFVALMIPVFIGIAIAAASGGGVGMAILLPVMFLAIAVLLAWLFSRFGMALPMTFADKQIRILEGWNFSKGYGGQLLSMALIQIGAVVVFTIAIWLLVLAGLVGMVTGFGAGFDAADFESLFQNPDDLLQRFLPFLAVFGVLYLVVMFVMQPILYAPWARAYQLIAADRLRERTTRAFT